MELLFKRTMMNDVAVRRTQVPKNSCEYDFGVCSARVGPLWLGRHAGLPFVSGR